MISKSAISNVLVISLAMISRVSANFLLIPVIMSAGMSLAGASKSYLGLVLGSYGLAQALFQLPLGVLSDFRGRKIILIIGLCVLVFTSFISSFITDVRLLLFM